MKKANAESDIWSFNKDVYDDKKLQEEIIFKTNNMDMKGYIIYISSIFKI